MTCANPYCEDGWVAFGNNPSNGAPASPCYLCRVHLAPVTPRREDTHTTTVDGAAAAEAERYGPLRGPPYPTAPERDMPDAQDVS